MLRLLRNSGHLVCLFLLGCFPLLAHGSKLDLYFGGFDFSAKTASSSGSVSGAGAYAINFSLPVMDNLDVGLGYSLIMSETIGGDAAYGLDVQASYFPLTPSSDLKIQSSNTIAVLGHIWRPFILAAYSARQFQSVSTQYNGFGLGLGFERKLEAKYSLKGLLKYSSFAGPETATATEIQALLGLSFSF